jgi:hypothetical protein
MARLDAAEYAYWRAMFRLGAFGSARDDFRAGIVAASAHNAGRLVASCQPGVTLRGEPATPQTFFPLPAARSREEREREVARRLKMWRRAWGG